MEIDQHQESTSLTPGDAADSRPEADLVVSDVPQEVVSSTAQPREGQLNPESHLRSVIGSYAIESKETENRGAVAHSRHLIHSPPVVASSRVPL